MPMPGGSDLHINAPLTNVSVAYFQDPNNFIADKVFPGIPVDKRSDAYWKYGKSDWRRSDAKKRAPGTESAGIGWEPTTDQYYAEVYAVHQDIDDQTRANADSNWRLDADATRLLTSHLLIQKDLIWTSTYFQTGVWATEVLGVASGPTGTQLLQWNQTNSNPLSDVTSLQTNFKLLTGFDTNFMVLGANVWKALKNHPAILDRIKYTQTGVITKDLVAGFFDIPAGRLLVAYASQATGPQVPDAVTQDAGMTYSWVHNPNSALLGFAPSAPGLLTPSAGYTFNWRGYGAGNRYGLTFAQMRMPQLKADRVEGEAAYVMKQVSADCGIFLNTVVSG